MGMTLGPLAPQGHTTNSRVGSLFAPKGEMRLSKVSYQHHEKQTQ